MMAEHKPHAALRFSGGDAEHHVLALGERPDGVRGARIERLDLSAAVAQRVEREPVLFRQPRDRKSLVPLSEHRERFHQRQADHGKKGLAFGQRNVVRAIGLGHRAQDHVLAVDERAVAVKDD